MSESMCQCGKPLTRVDIFTHHPEDYELFNRRDGSRWVIEDGHWKAADRKPSPE